MAVLFADGLVADRAECLSVRDGLGCHGVCPRARCGEPSCRGATVDSESAFTLHATAAQLWPFLVGAAADGWIVYEALPTNSRPVDSRSRNSLLLTVLLAPRGASGLFAGSWRFGSL